MEKNNFTEMNDEICMAFLKSRTDLIVKEGTENRVYNVITLDKSDISIAAIDFTLNYIRKQNNES